MQRKNSEKKLRTGKMREEDLENKVLSKDFLMCKTFLQSGTHTLHVGVFFQHRSIHDETYCTSLHLKLQGKTSGGRENINTEQVESRKTTASYSRYLQTHCAFHVIRMFFCGNGQPFPPLFL